MSKKNRFNHQPIQENPNQDFSENQEKENQEKNNTISSVDKEEETSKIFNLSTVKPSDIKAPKKEVITNPIKAWGKK